MIELGLIVVGLTTLLGGGDLLLRGATSIAESFGMTRLMIGLTIVSLGTSAPETAICVDAALQAKPEIALGNIIGSNVANVLLILGLTATVIPIVVDRKIIQREVPIMIAATFLFLFLVVDGKLTQANGLMLLLAMVGFLVWQFLSASKEPVHNVGDQSDALGKTRAKRGFVLSGVMVLAGVAMLWFGAGWMVKGATGLAGAFGVSELVIGLTIVAIGSSSPEIVTSLLAARRGYPEMAVGSVIGSNIANLLLVGGVTSALSDEIVVPTDAFEFDIPIMVVTSIACLPIFTSGHKIARWEGILFLVCFVAFNGFLFFRSALTDIFPMWSQMVWPIASPLIFATAIVLAYRWWKIKWHRNSKTI